MNNKGKLPRNFVVSVVVSLFILILLSGTGCSIFQEQFTELEATSGKKYVELISLAGAKVSNTLNESSYFPVYTQGGKWVDTNLGEWMEGYYAGIAWLIYQQSRVPSYLTLAQDYTARLQERKDNSGSEGLGQVFYPSDVLGYQITGNRVYRQNALDAAGTQLSRLTKCGYIPAWGEAGDTLFTRRLRIETMLGLELMYWASNTTGDASYSRAATSHALFSLGTLVDSDGKVLHMADFNPNTGKPEINIANELKNNTRYSFKGYEAASSWAFGQAAAIYGFTTAYRYSGNVLFLNNAKIIADYYLANTPENGIPLWDLNLPAGEPKVYDTSAAALAATGMLKLADVVTTEADKIRYRTAAEKIITELVTNHVRTSNAEAGILDGGVFDMKRKLGVGGATSVGDYYFVEALLMLLDREV